jgi:hypothetical protein
MFTPSFALIVALARAQSLPSEPIQVANGLVTLSSDISATIGPVDEGFFNYTDYDHSALRLFRIDLATAIRAGKRVSLLGEFRSENIEEPDVYALYLRVRPWPTHNFDVQIGRVPPTFGAFGRRNYAVDNPLIGYPLAYQYLTSLRADALPATADDLLRMRGRGWLAAFPIGNRTPAHGVPLASAFTWDTGIQAHAASEHAEITGSVTAGTVANPLFHDDNDGKLIALRGAVRPLPGLVVGASAARGAFVSTSAADRAIAAGAPGDKNDFTQTAWGGDVEYSRGYYLVRAEAVFSRWKLPIVSTPAIADPLTAAAISVEGRYKIDPALYVAARVDHLGFNEITGSSGSESWDAPVTRVEVGGGYALRRNITAKASLQLNWRRGTLQRTGVFPAAQLVYWF